MRPARRRGPTCREPVVPDELGHLEHDLVGLAEGVLADELHDLVEVVLLLQDLRGERAVVDEVALVLEVRVCPGRKPSV